MSSSIRDLILANVPEDGSAVGNMALLALLRETMPGLTDEEYAAAKDDLVAKGVLGKGRGRGGSVFLLGFEDDEDEDGDDGFALTAQEPATPSAPKSASGKKKAAKKSDEPVQVLSYRHTETRVNNPEVGMVHPDNDPDQPKTVWKYDPHLDPELMFDSQRGAVEKLIDDALALGDADAMRDALVELKRLQEPYLNWAGKAEGASFAVDTVSLHVHERVDPATILANARKRLKGEKAGEAWRQADLFAAAFENLPLRQALDFYHHEKGWSNRLIAGDSLLVMNSLLHKESMAGKVQMIYIDPPYGIKYGSNFQPFTGQKAMGRTDKDEDLSSEPEMIKAFRDTWELGIHSYLTYLRDRLNAAKKLLADTGSLFVQISDDNLHLVRNLTDEIFGPKNYVVTILVKKKGSQKGGKVDPVNDYLVWVAKDKSCMTYFQIYDGRETDEEITADFANVEMPNGEVTTLARLEKQAGVPTGRYRNDLASFSKDFPGCRLFKADPSTGGNPGASQAKVYEHCGMAFDPGIKKGLGWKAAAESSSGFSGMKRLAVSGRLHIGDKQLAVKRYPEDFGLKAVSNWWDGIGGPSNPIYVVQTNEKILERCILMTTAPGDLVLDPTCGSGTTAIVAEKWGRRWITCDTSRVAITLAKKRLMTAAYDYYTLRYPQEGLKGGFVYKTAEHIMAARIANNPDIDTIYEQKHPAILLALSALNDSLLKIPPMALKPWQGYRKGKQIDFTKGDTLQEWEVPYDFPEGWPKSAEQSFADFHAARVSMQVEMDRAIAANAEPKALYDKPEPDKSRLRITGPFSVEAVPAPTVLSLDESATPAEADTTVARSGETSRQTQWRDELIRSGIRAKGGAMLKFTDLEAIPGVRHLHASGTLDSGERVVVSFGPEHAALEQKQVERAIEDAQTLVPKPKFVVFCAFTFDPEAAKDIDETNWPGVTLLKAQMNTDLLTEDLKKARSSNQSFWLMGQPDAGPPVQLADGTWQVEVRGFDYFDPREGELISGGASKIAMWSLDTDYDGRSLMPHQVFFPMAGAKDGWNRLKKTIRAELDEDLLQQFHGTVSLPFEAGDHRRVAVKIVDDRGIESLKIMNLE
ncbi:site-specific DNA-methyltransferase [Novosphingobium sp. KCTC 2891]|uniref:site-specific DNA-methyltransferase n=1 Tax=Novosphingobium sp. KCTC 2891 TaxID=2989730 RepID=UPI002221B704|nr:site-specific DNA-methyltransferase [Novosphingobium sp. KCTC 2891]MCW1383923.1 site-specific DNA-methyltransferase [Novosphingobium sp. KCTC 2891]